ncbi:MAG TPA: aminodeoxychorismate/anthranilate synthase component II [Gemmatimonadales bacterium]|jgi:anthranilate synthase/aminodeoxychorismate synthase-like glutamine amidotransferase|nr:aminodeoxychorismate/anthranilate synthase component II [Gemmatimonadales bacterium]
MILVLDNTDSFVHNLARYVRELGGEPRVRRSNRISLDEIATMAPSHIIISPGPCTPAESGVSVEAVRRFGADIPILGVCLGHQCIGAAYGGRIVRASHPMHGKSSEIGHEGRGVMAGLPAPLTVGRYHSLVVDRGSLPAALEITATAPDGDIMALQHRSYPVHGVQFHPESVLTGSGHRIVGNFLEMGVGHGA